MLRSIDMETVVRTLALPFDIKYPDGNYRCPVCGRKGKLNIDFQNDTFNCPACGKFSGSAFDMWAWGRMTCDGVSISSPDRKEFCRLVAKDFYAYKGAGGLRARPPRFREAEKPAVKTFDAAEEGVLDETYRALLENLILSEKHRTALRRRGMPDEIINANGYRTAPVAANAQITRRILSAGCQTEGVPGFMKYSEWTFRNLGPGFLIPCRSVDGRIHGLQIRADKRTYGKQRPLAVKGFSAEAARGRLRRAKRGLRKRPKYMTISSKGKPCGAAGFTKPHYNPGWDNSSEVIITEGPLKGDIISMFTGKATLSVLGVCNLAFVPSMLWELRQIGKTKISVAYDMDMYAEDKDAVRRGLLALQRHLIHAGFRFDRRDWKEEYERFGLKGYDDYLLFRYQGK